MDVRGKAVLVTGANRGIGRAFGQELHRRGARRIYATARDVDSLQATGVTALRLDVTDRESIDRAATLASDVDLIINNAGISTHTRLIDSELGDIQKEMDTNFWGPLLVTRAFAPVLRERRGAVLNLLSLLSWEHRPNYGAYSVAKAAAWAMSNVVRQELAPAGVSVTSVHVGFVDTDMADYVTTPKEDPAELVAAALDALAGGQPEIVYGTAAIGVRNKLSSPLSATYTGFGLPESLHLVAGRNREMTL